MHSMKAKPLSRQRGITLIESLVAIVISALGILGILGVQMRTRYPDYGAPGTGHSPD